MQFRDYTYSTGFFSTDNMQGICHLWPQLSSFLCALQVLIAAEDTLRRLQVSGAERNAILDTLRYMEGLHERQLSHARASSGPHQAPSKTESRADHEQEPSDAKPFTRCGRPPCTPQHLADVFQGVGRWHDRLVLVLEAAHHVDTMTTLPGTQWRRLWSCSGCWASAMWM